MSDVITDYIRWLHDYEERLKFYLKNLEQDHGDLILERERLLEADIPMVVGNVVIDDKDVDRHANIFPILWMCLVEWFNRLRVLAEHAYRLLHTGSPMPSFGEITMRLHEDENPFETGAYEEFPQHFLGVGDLRTKFATFPRFNPAVLSEEIVKEFWLSCKEVEKTTTLVCSQHRRNVELHEENIALRNKRVIASDWDAFVRGEESIKAIKRSLVDLIHDCMENESLVEEATLLVSGLRKGEGAWMTRRSEALSSRGGTLNGSRLRACSGAGEIIDPSRATPSSLLTSPRSSVPRTSDKSVLPMCISECISVSVKRVAEIADGRGPSRFTPRNWSLAQERLSRKDVEAGAVPEAESGSATVQQAAPSQLGLSPSEVLLSSEGATGLSPPEGTKDTPPAAGGALRVDVRVDVRAIAVDKDSPDGTLAGGVGQAGLLPRDGAAVPYDTGEGQDMEGEDRRPRAAGSQETEERGKQDALGSEEAADARGKQGSREAPWEFGHAVTLERRAHHRNMTPGPGAVSQFPPLPTRARSLGDIGIVGDLVPEDFEEIVRITVPTVHDTVVFFDYAPKVFSRIRQLFNISPESYVRSIALKPVQGGGVSEMKSGSLFYFSWDRKYVIKTVAESELAFFFRDCLSAYHKYLEEHRFSFLSKFFGLHRIRLPNRKDSIVAVMDNVFHTSLPIHEKYDLKGSSFDRTVPELDIRQKRVSILKDGNLRNPVCVGAERDALLRQLRLDAYFLMSLNIMDYSLLLGVSKGTGGAPSDANESSDSGLSSKTAESEQPEPPAFLSRWQQDDGGTRGVDGNTYFFGVIDVLQEYNLMKKLAHTYKSSVLWRNDIDTVRSEEYAQRFMRFMEKKIRQFPHEGEVGPPGRFASDASRPKHDGGG